MKTWIKRILHWLRGKAGVVIHAVSRRALILVVFWLFVLALHRLRIYLVAIDSPLQGDVYTMAQAGMGCGLLKVVEEMLLFGIDTKSTVEKNPVAYAIYILAFAYIIGQAAL